MHISIRVISHVTLPEPLFSLHVSHHVDVIV
jgi:hypothetical protein